MRRKKSTQSRDSTQSRHTAALFYRKPVPRPTSRTVIRIRLLPITASSCGNQPTATSRLRSHSAAVSFVSVTCLDCLSSPRHPAVML